jgi:hypothetical protein
LSVGWTGLWSGSCQGAGHAIWAGLWYGHWSAICQAFVPNVVWLVGQAAEQALGRVTGCAMLNKVTIQILDLIDFGFQLFSGQLSGTF